MTKELKPCPLCGRNAYISVDPIPTLNSSPFVATAGYFGNSTMYCASIRCSNNECKCNVAVFDSIDKQEAENKAIQAWNRRSGVKVIDKPKPCPFCGEDVKVEIVDCVDQYRLAKIECKNCFCAMSRWDKNEEMATETIIEEWNKREGESQNEKEKEI